VSQATKTHSAIARGFHARKVKHKQQRGAQRNADVLWCCSQQFQNLAQCNQCLLSSRYCRCGSWWYGLRHRSHRIRSTGSMATSLDNPVSLNCSVCSEFWEKFMSWTQESKTNTLQNETKTT